MPSTTQVASSDINSSMTAAIRSKPFWSTMREIMPISGRFIAASSTGNPYRIRTCRFGGRLSAQVVGSVRRRQDADRASDPTGSVSIPFRTPTRSAARRRRMPSNPKPNSGVCISRAYCRLTVVNRVGVVDPALEEADASPVLEPLDRQQLPRQVEPRQPVGREQPLIGEVVNREHARHRAQHGMRGVERAEIDGREPRLPVVSVHDRRPDALPPGKLQRGADQQPRTAAGCPDSRRCRRRTAPRDRTGPGNRPASRGLRSRAALRRIRRLACIRRRSRESARRDCRRSPRGSGAPPGSPTSRGVPAPPAARRARRPDRRFSRMEPLRIR